MLRGAAIKSVLTSKGPVVGTYRGIFNLCKINLVRAACPKEIASSRENTATIYPVIVEKNYKQVGHVVATNYTPAAVVVAGGARRAALLQRGIIHSYAWVEAGAMSINADDAVGCNELTQKLNILLGDKFRTTNEMPSATSAWIVEVYPFENYLIYSQKGKMFRQHYSLDPVNRTCLLQGSPIEVNTAYVNACISDMGMVAQVRYGWKDPVDAVRMYRAARAKGSTHPLQPDFASVKLTGMGKVVTALAAVGVSPIDFARWSTDMQNSKELAA